MAQLLSFTESDLLGSVTHVDTEQIIIEIENPLIFLLLRNTVAVVFPKNGSALLSH